MKREIYTKKLKKGKFLLLLLFSLLLLNPTFMVAQKLLQGSTNNRSVPCECDIVCPTDITISCDIGIDPDETGWATLQGDDCPDEFDLNYDDNENLDNCGLGTIERTWTVTFNCNGTQTETCQQIITIIDETPPEITCPANVTFDCELGDAGTATASDNCDPDPDIGYSDVEYLDDCGLGTIERTWTATDCAGNSASCLQIITIQDIEAPTITCPADITFDCTIGDAGTATATDNCDPDPSIGYTDVEDLDNCGLGTIERTWTATDCAGNSASCLQIITIQDIEAPAITCPADMTFDCTIGDAGTATATDNCDPEPVIGYSDVDNLDDCGLGTIERTWTATDCAGNIASCLQVITIQDNEPPVITCPADVTFQECEMGNAGVATVTDNCDPDPDLTFSDVSDGGTNPEIITRTWTATDCAGLAAECDQIITIYCEQGEGCTYTQGYWKTHSIYGPAPYDETWALILPDGEDTEFYYSNQTYYEVLWTPPRGGNAYYILAHQFIAAELNFLNGADPSAAQDAFNDAEVLFDNPVNTPSHIRKLKKNSPERQLWLNLATVLDDYNNGDIGPGHCDDEGDRSNVTPITDNENNLSLSAYPNPFTNSVTIEFVLPVDTDAVLEIYNMNGYRIATLFNGKAKADQTYSFKFKGATHLKQETYMYLLRAGDVVKRGRLIMIR